MTRFILFLIPALLTVLHCDSDIICESNYNIDWSKVNCGDPEVINKITQQLNFAGCVDEEVMECIINSRDSTLFKFVHDSLSHEMRRNSFSNYSLLLSSIYKGNVYAFKHLIPYNERYIYTPKYEEHLIEHLIQYCGTVDALKDTKASPISTYDPMVGVQLLEEYFKHDSIHSITIQEKLKRPLLFLSLNSLNATRYLIKKGANINSKIISPDPKQEDFYYLERFIQDLIHPPGISVGGEQVSFYTEEDVIERLDLMDFIIEKGGIMLNKDSNNDPHLFLLREAIKNNRLKLLKKIVPRYKHIYEKSPPGFLIECVKQSNNEAVLNYLYEVLID